MGQKNFEIHYGVQSLINLVISLRDWSSDNSKKDDYEEIHIKPIIVKLLTPQLKEKSLNTHRKMTHYIERSTDF